MSLSCGSYIVCPSHPPMLLCLLLDALWQKNEGQILRLDSSCGSKWIDWFGWLGSDQWISMTLFLTLPCYHTDLDCIVAKEKKRKSGVDDYRLESSLSSLPSREFVWILEIVAFHASSCLEWYAVGNLLSVTLAVLLPSFGVSVTDCIPGDFDTLPFRFARLQ